MLPQMRLSEHLQSLKVISADRLKQPGICSLLCAFLFFQVCVQPIPVAPCGPLTLMSLC